MSNARRLSEDDRYGLASAAEAGARANRPSHLVTIGVLVMMLALTVGLLAWRADARAAGKLRKEARDLATLKQSSERLSELKAQAAASPDEDRYRPIPDMLSRLGNLAREAGLEGVPDIIPRTVNESATDSRRVNYIYTNIRTESIEDLVAWAALTCERVPGMHLRRLGIKPQANAWLVDVTFARYERLE